MGAYLIRRLLLMILTLFGISVIIFVLLRVVPGNIADILFDAAGLVNPAEKAKIEAELGLDKPIWCNTSTGSAVLLRGDSATPTCPSGPRSRRSCRAFPSPRSLPHWRCSSRSCSACRSA